MAGRPSGQRWLGGQGARTGPRPPRQRSRSTSVRPHWRGPDARPEGSDRICGARGTAFPGDDGPPGPRRSNPHRARGQKTSLRAFLELLSVGHASTHAIETLDQLEVWERYLPEWASRPQHAPVQPVPPLDCRPAPARDRGKRGRAPRKRRAPAGSPAPGRPAARHRERDARRPLRGRRSRLPPGSASGWVCPPKTRWSAEAGSPPPFAARHRHPARPRRPGHGQRRGRDVGDETHPRTAPRYCCGGREATGLGAWTPWKADLVDRVGRTERVPSWRAGPCQRAHRSLRKTTVN